MIAGFAVPAALPLQAPRAQAELVCGMRAVRPGQEFFVALHIRMPKGWHVYYVNPGESGQPPRLAWNVPDSLRVGRMLWPAPQRLVVGGVASNVYTGDVWLPMRVRLGKNVAFGHLDLKAKANWLLCSGRCIPDSADLGLQIDVRPQAEVKPDVLRQVTGSLKLIPSLRRDNVSAKLADRSVIVNLPRLKTDSVRFFGADPNFFGADAEQVEQVGNRTILKLPLSRYAASLPRRIVGIVSPADATPFAIDVPLQLSAEAKKIHTTDKGGS